MVGGMGSLLPWSNPAAKCLAIRGVGEAEAPRRYPITAKAAPVRTAGSAMLRRVREYGQTNEAVATATAGKSDAAPRYPSEPAMR